jgi:hippurate hydrolase
MRGTLRTFDEGVRGQILQRLGAFASDVARAYRAEATLELSDMSCAAVVNHEGQTSFVRECVEAELGADAAIAGRPVMASDDMCYFLRERPGCYFRVGIAPTHGRPAPHHAPEFEMNEDGLPVGLRVALGVMLNALPAR